MFICLKNSQVLSPYSESHLEKVTLMHKFTKRICMIFRTKLIRNLLASSYLSQKIILHLKQHKLSFISFHLHEKSVLFSAKQSRSNPPVSFWFQRKILNILSFIFYSNQSWGSSSNLFSVTEPFVNSVKVNAFSQDNEEMAHSYTHFLNTIFKNH